MANYSKNKKYHYTYRTTNLINGRYYLGMHSTNRLDDGYLGSGKRLYYELNKYGRDNFKFEILEQFNSREDLVQAEINLITEQDLKNPNCINLKPGGSGGFCNEQHKNVFMKASSNTNYRVKNQDPDFVQKRQKGFNQHLKKLSEDVNYRKNFSEKIKKYYKEQGQGSFKGRTHTKEVKEKMSVAKKGKYEGYNNSQYGTCWITNGEHNKKIRKGDNIPEGWRLGRVLKH